MNKKVENVKNDLYDINIPYFTFPTQGEKINDDIMKSSYGGRLGGRGEWNFDFLLSCFFHDFRGIHDIDPLNGSAEANITSRVIPFFYSEALDSLFLYKNQSLKLFSYWNSIKLKFREALKLNKYENDLVLIIETIDEQNVADLIRKWEIIYSDIRGGKFKPYDASIHAPRFRKLCRLRNFNDFIIKTCLSMLHLFYWIDFKNNVTNNKNINEYINRVLYITLQLKEMLYQELDEEFPDDIIAKEINRIKLKK